MPSSKGKAKAFSEEGMDNNGYLNSELKSLGIHPKKKNELNDKEELQELADNIKQSLYQDYKTAYSDENEKDKVDEDHFGHIIWETLFDPLQMIRQE
jgi:hypothetical protein